jgi:PIN domain nuclease of toxin-antitoxin system
MTVSSSAVLLDTCATIWLANGQLDDRTVELVVAAGLARGVFISPVSAWEIGTLARPRVGRPPQMEFLPDPKTWFARIMAVPGFKEAAYKPEIAIDASHLPGKIHSDPADRLIISTARHLRIPIVTRDSKILDYGATGHVDVIAC